MRRLCLALLIVTLMMLSAHAQPLGPDTVWVRGSSGGIGDEHVPGSVLVLPDQSILVSGSAGIAIWRDYFVAHFDSGGRFLEERQYGDPEAAEWSGLLCLDEGGVVLAGHQSWPTYACQTVRLSPGLDSLGGREYQTSPDETQNVNALCPSWEGGVVIGGLRGLFSVHWLAVLLAVDAQGDTVWSRLWGEGEADDCMRLIERIHPTPDGGYCLVGYLHCAPVPSMSLCKLDGQGNVEWTRSWPADTVTLADVVPLADGYLVGGARHDSLYGATTPLFIRTDLRGDTLWTRRLEGRYGHAQVRRMLGTEDGRATALLDGYRADVISEFVALWRLDEHGDALWARDFIFDLPFVLTLWSVELARDAQNRYLILALTDGMQSMLLCTEPDETILPADPPPPPLPGDIALHDPYPNPFNSSTQIRFTLPQASYVALKLYDLLGREIAVLHQGPLSAGEHHVAWDAQGQPSGLYFVRLEAGGAMQTRKLLLVR